MENDKIEALTLHVKFFVPSHFLEVVAKMRKLRFLDVSFVRGNVGKPEFLSKELRWINWSCYPGSSLPSNFQPLKLGGLILQWSRLKQLWMDHKRLPSLKVLDLRYSDNLITTPDFDGLPNLEELMLSRCDNLTEVHPSIGRLQRLVSLNLEFCENLKMFPPIIRLEKLETLVLTGCRGLRKFPEIQQDMDCLEHLLLKYSGIEVVRSSIGQYCTNLVSMDLSYCKHLKSIEGNFRLLKRLKTLHFQGCERLKELPKDLLDVECCLEEISLPPKRQLSSSQLSPKDLVVLDYPFLPRYIRKLDLGRCNLEDGDIPSDIGELSNLQVLLLYGNKFSRLHSSLSQLSQLKFLKLSYCENLVELPELPSSLAVLDAAHCNSLEIDQDLPTNCKWLWNISLSRNENKHHMIDGHRVLQSMLKGNAIEDHVISLVLPGHVVPKGLVPLVVKGKTFTLQLPHDWSNDVTGFLLCFAYMKKDIQGLGVEITMKQETVMNSQSELWEESNETPESDCSPITFVGYVSFSSLRRTTWWNSAYNTISFSFEDSYNSKMIENRWGVQLIPKKRQNDPILETTKATTDCFEFWDEEYGYRKTFDIVHDSKSYITISWFRSTL